MRSNGTIKNQYRKIFTKEYEKHHHDVIMVGDQKTIESLVESFREVMELQGVLEAKLKLVEENKKKQLALSKAESLESIKLEKCTGQENEVPKILHLVHGILRLSPQ